MRTETYCAVVAAARHVFGADLQKITGMRSCGEPTKGARQARWVIIDFASGGKKDAVGKAQQFVTRLYTCGRLVMTHWAGYDEDWGWARLECEPVSYADVLRRCSPEAGEAIGTAGALLAIAHGRMPDADPALWCMQQIPWPPGVCLDNYARACLKRAKDAVAALRYPVNIPFPI